MQRICLPLVATLVSLSVSAQPPPALALLPAAPGSINRFAVHGKGGTTNQIFILEAATNLIHWQEIAVLHHAPFSFQDLDAPASTTRFYRLRTRPRTIQDDWKNQIQAPLVSERLGWTFLDTEAEPFLSPPEDAYNGQPQWVKFTILSNEPARVFFQDSTRYPFHYEFATNRLAPFKGLHRAAFDAAVLHPPTQRAVLGAVLFDTDQIVGTNCAIQFVGLSPYSRERIAELFNLVRSAIDASPGVRFTYLPTFEQQGVAQTQRAWLADHGIELAELASGGSAQVEGWAIGRLRYIPTAEIASASMDGRLKPSDIMLTDALPAELPFLAGILTHTPATPNSHVVILAQSHAIPLAAVADISEFARLRQLDGVEVYLSVRNRTTVTPIEGQLDSVSRAKLMELKAPPLVRILPKLAYGALSAPADNLRMADSRYFGGKAAHYGLLRRTIPSNAPPAIAFSFDLWEAFLDQPLASGNTLRAEIAALLAPHQNYPPNLAALKTDLAAIRHLITDTARFNSAQRQAILNALNGFSPDRKLRFRSSSNAEDETTFSAAGLYDSFSGCLADDLDPDSVGPSAFTATRASVPVCWNRGWIPRCPHRNEPSCRTAISASSTSTSGRACRCATCRRDPIQANFSPSKSSA